MNFRRLAINGRFLTAGPTGVRRVAKELLSQLANHHSELADVFDELPRLFVPPDLANGETAIFEVKRGGLFRGALWEQIDLPRFCRPDLLLNFCNVGPVASTCAITMIHDAQVFITSDSYSWAFRNWYRQILPVIGRRHARILTVSEFSATQLVKYGIAKRERISVIPNGVDHILAYEPVLEIISRFNLIPRNFVLGLANVQSHKNIGVLLKAFAAPMLADLKLVLVGTANREQFEMLGHSVPANVIFTGQICDGELRALLESALCVGFPSTTEGFGLPPLEGMLLGCPAIMAPCGALTEVGGQGAVFAAPNDPRQWIDAIRRLVDEPSYWTDYSRAGRERASYFTWKRAGDKLVEVIKEVAIAEAKKR